MSMTCATRHRNKAALAALVVLALSVPGQADQLADFHAAVTQASEQYRIAMETLETQGQAETAAAVQRFRASWHAISDQFGKNRPAPFVGDEQYGTMFMLVDTRVIGVLLAIDLGSRDAARDGMAPIRETLADLSARSAPARQP
jgi:hypothetical protein